MDYTYVYFDTEFTGFNESSTLISIGLVTDFGDELYVTLNDYNSNQINTWIHKNVILHLSAFNSVSSKEAYNLIYKWLHEISKGKKISLVSAGLSMDLILLFDLCKYRFEDDNLDFNAIRDLPDFLNHSCHFDLNTMFLCSGISPDINREDFLIDKISGIRHNALYDAKIVRSCFKKLINNFNL